MAYRQKKLTLDAPYNKISKLLWQNKKNNIQIDKQNMKLKTKIHQINNKSLNKQSSIMYNKLKIKFQKLSNRFKEQRKWIKQINHIIQERNYQQLLAQVHKIQSILTGLTQKTLIQEKKYKKINKKIEKIQENNKHPKQMITLHTQYLFQLEYQKQQLMKKLENKSLKFQKIQNNNKIMNKQIIQLLKIKNQLKNNELSKRKQVPFHKAIKYKEIMIDEIQM